MRIRVKACRKIPWIAMALQIKTRLWLGGVVSEHRNRHLADALFHLVKQCCLPLQELLVVPDGWAAYPKRIRRMFREKARSLARQGRCRLRALPGLLIGTVIKRADPTQVVKVCRRSAPPPHTNAP